MSDNWGRWGAEDERGTLNLITPDATRRGLATVREARSVTLGLPVRSGRGPVAGIRPPPQHFMTRDGGDYAAGLPERPGYGFADDAVLLACHGTTHLDALCHVWQDGTMWNGYPASSVTSRGAARCGIHTAGPIVTRGVLADLHRAGEDPLPDGPPVSRTRLEAALDGVRLAAGDALLVRTGWLHRWREGVADTTSWPGLDIDCADLVIEHDLALVGADNIAVEVGPATTPDCQMPLHIALQRDGGVPFLELLDLEALASSGRREFLLVVAPLNLVGGTASPVAPVAVL